MTLQPANDFLRCDYCETPHFPNPNADGIRVLGIASEYACPACRNEPLAHASVGGERMYYCEKCHGLLISMNVFPAIVEELRSHHQSSEYAGKQPDWEGMKRLIKCPKCRQPMDAHPYAGPGAVIIDSCSDCYLNWLDHGELQRVVRAPDCRYIMPLDDEERQHLKEAQLLG